MLMSWKEGNWPMNIGIVVGQNEVEMKDFIRRWKIIFSPDWRRSLLNDRSVK
jgi:hypothetical protein